MSWHSDTYPGRLALFASDSPAELDKAKSALQTHYLSFQEAALHVGNNTFVATMVRLSPFCTVVPQEAGAMVCVPTCRAVADIYEDLQTLAKDLFGGWGNTKPIYVFQRLRAVETRSVANRVISCDRQWSSALGSGLLEEHGRLMFAAPPDVVGAPPLERPKEVYFPGAHNMTIDESSLTGPLAWVSLAPKSQPSLAALQNLMEHCRRNKCWEIASHCWQSSMIPVMTVIRLKSADTTVVSLGSVGGCGILTWPLDKHESGDFVRFFHSDRQPTALSWHPCLDLSDIEAVSTKVISPLHAHCLRKNIRGPGGVCFLRSGPPRTVLRHAALACFWNLELYVLKKIAGVSLGIAHKGLTIAPLLQSMLEKALPDLPPAQILEIMGLRCAPSTLLTFGEIPQEAIDELAPEADQKEIKDTALGTF
eukprot:7427326-Heterocapsa_arctica.AAC.1